ncbi:MAG: DUF4870 domain-containing protein [Flavobacteriales bacterium]
MGGYLIMFASQAGGLPLPLLNLLAAWIYYHFLSDSSRFVRYHTLHSLLAQIPVSLLNAAFVIWLIVDLVQGDPFDMAFLGFFLAVLLVNLLYIIFSIIAAVKAYKGRFYYFIFFGPLAFETIYRIEQEKAVADPERSGKDKEDPVNRPPF